VTGTVPVPEVVSAYQSCPQKSVGNSSLLTPICLGVKADYSQGIKIILELTPFGGDLVNVILWATLMIVYRLLFSQTHM